MKNTLKQINFREKVYFYYFNDKKTIRINSGVKSSESDLERNKILIKNIENKINNIIYKYQIENNNKYPDTTYIKQKLNFITNNEDDINSLYELFYTEKIKKLKPSSSIQWSWVGDKLEKYNELNKVDINKIDEKFIKDFQTYIFSLNISDNSHRKIFIYLKAFILWLCKNEYIKEYTINWLDFEIERFEKEFETLTIDELRFLKEKRKTKITYKKCLDMFLFSCYTGLRYSDLIRLNKSHISKGQIIMNTLKTNKKVIISLNETAKDILIENEYNLYLYNNSMLDVQIKEMLKSYSDEQTTFKENIILTKKINKIDVAYNDFRYNFISIHSARRTFITILIDNNVSLNKIMLASGHTNLSILNKYLNRKHNTETNLANYFN